MTKHTPNYEFNVGLSAACQSYHKETGDWPDDVAFTAKGIESLWRGLCGDCEEMLMKVNPVTEGATVWGFTVHLTDEDLPNEYRIMS